MAQKGHLPQQPVRGVDRLRVRRCGARAMPARGDRSSEAPRLSLGGLGRACSGELPHTMGVSDDLTDVTADWRTRSVGVLRSSGSFGPEHYLVLEVLLPGVAGVHGSLPAEVVFWGGKPPSRAHQTPRMGRSDFLADASLVLTGASGCSTARVAHASSAARAPAGSARWRPRAAAPAGRRPAGRGAWTSERSCTLIRQRRPPPAYARAAPPGSQVRVPFGPFSRLLPPCAVSTAALRPSTTFPHSR